MISDVEAVFPFQPQLQLKEPIVLDFLQPAAHIAYEVMVHMGMIIPPQIIAGYAIPKIHLLYNMKLTQQF
ncbi:hypothetical protein D3C74_449020 [compost metagenome]